MYHRGLRLALGNQCPIRYVVICTHITKKTQMPQSLWSEPWHRRIEPIEATSRCVEDQRRAGVEGIESEAMICCVEDRALASSLASSPIEPGVEPIEPGVEPYRAHDRAWRRACVELY